MFLLFISITVVFLDKARSQSDSNNVEHGASLVRTAFPIYPLIARTAYVQGNVEVAVVVGADGGVKSAVAMSGPELLKRAAIDSAEHSQFECSGCSRENNSIQILYTFVLEGDNTCDLSNARSSVQTVATNQPRAANETSHITVTTSPLMFCDPASDHASDVRRHSMKCLYLWRCGPLK